MTYSLRNLFGFVLLAAVFCGLLVNGGSPGVVAATSLGLLLAVLAATGIMIGRYNTKAAAPIAFIVGVLAFIASEFLPHPFNATQAVVNLGYSLLPNRANPSIAAQEHLLLVGALCGVWTAVFAHRQRLGG